jgi:hypothetical protein
MKKTLFITFILFTFFYGCKGKSENNQNQIIEDNMKIIIPESLLADKDQILKRLKVQLSWQNMDESDPEAFNIQEEDVILGSKIKLDAMQRRGFKLIDNEMFNEKVKNIFGINLKKIEQCNFLHDHGHYVIYVTPKYITETDEAREGGIGDFQRANYYFFRDKNFMTFQIPLMIGSIEEKSNGTSEIIVWDEEYYRNKFLFNDDQQAFTWLLNNDMDFLETLIRVFGYDKNNMLNRKVLNTINKKYNKDLERDYEQLANLFARKDCNGKLQIRSKLIKTITDNTTVEDNALLTMLEEYLDALMGEEKTKKNEDVQANFTWVERAKIFTIIGCEVNKIYSKLEISPGLQNWSEVSVLYNELVSNDKLLDEIKKEQYYKLPEVEETVGKVMRIIEMNAEMDAER